MNMYRTKVDSWKRPSELINIDNESKSPSLWGSNGVQPAGINQGSLGDCWLLAAMGSLAEKPERVKAVFTNSDYSPNGIFQFNFWHKGK